jgi:hypothetical protein
MMLLEEQKEDFGNAASFIRLHPPEETRIDQIIKGKITIVIYGWCTMGPSSLINKKT